MKTADAVRAMARCPRGDCRRPVGTSCTTASGRNHTERVVAAIGLSIAALAPEHPDAIALRAKYGEQARGGR